jgi:hypothetical protein
LYLLFGMKHTNVFNSIPMPFKHSFVGTCLTIFRSVVLVALSASFLTACNPGGTTNNNGADKSGVSGGGATKDPGDGTGGSTGDGGGGQGVQCGESQNQKLRNKLFVRDIYEAIYNHNREMKTIANNSEGTAEVSPETIRTLTASLKQYFGPASFNLDFTTEKFWTDFSKKISFIEDDRELYPSKDANSPIALPKECKIVQIAYWAETSGASDDGILYINKSLWNKLDQLNKIGLLAHEYFFKQARRAQYKNSDNVRFKIGELLSTTGLTPLFTFWNSSAETRASSFLPASKNGFKFCIGLSREEPSAKIQLYQYEGSDKLQHFVIPMLKSESINLSFFQTYNFSFDPKKDKDLALGTDLLIFPPDLYEKIISTGYFVTQYPDWFSNYYEDSGLLAENLVYPSLMNYMNSVSQLYKKNEVLWSDYISTPSKPIKLSLLAPTPPLWVERKFKSREDIVSTIHEELVNILRNCTPANERQINEAIVILNKEIHDSIKAGVLPKEFTRWLEAARALRPWRISFKKDFDLPDNYCNSIKSSIKTDLPTLLLNAHLNNYTEEQLQKYLGEKSFYPYQTMPSRPGTFRVSQGDSNLDFELSCNNFDKVYLNEFKSKTITTKEHQPLSLKVADIPLKSILDYATSSDEVKVDRERLVNTLNNVHIFARDFKNGEKKILDSFDFSCNYLNAFNLDICQDIKSFLSDFQGGGEVAIEFCSNKEILKLAKAGTSSATESCAIFKIKSSQNTYKLYFSYSNDEFSAPEFESLKLIKLQLH